VHEPPAAVRAAGIVVALIVVLAIVAIAFALPAARSKPHDVPIGAAGPQAASGLVADVLEQHAPGAFAITYYPGEAALRDAIRNRDVYGGISFGPDGRTLLIATGGSPLVAQMLTQVGSGIAQQAGGQLRTEELAPPTADDPRGAGLAASVLRGNPLSGLNSAPEMLPSGWGTVGQLLPQGANATLLRSTAFFDCAGATTAIAVLTCWVLAGAALIGFAAARQRRTAAA
jgi:hypothetical protein